MGQPRSEISTRQTSFKECGSDWGKMPECPADRKLVQLRLCGKTCWTSVVKAPFAVLPICQKPATRSWDGNILGIWTPPAANQYDSEGVSECSRH